jgi:hypothetical protein
MNMLLRVRRFYLLDNREGLTALMSQQGKRFIETVGILLELQGNELEDDDAIIDSASNCFDINRELLKELHSLRKREEVLPKEKEECLYSWFLSALSQLSEYVDRVH